MNADIKAFNENRNQAIERFASFSRPRSTRDFQKLKSKIWHRHPVWFLEDNPTVGYSKLKAGIRLMFWSGADFREDRLKPGTGKFKDASIIYTSVDEVRTTELARWLKKSREIQWDYKNIYKTKGS